MSAHAHDLSTIDFDQGEVIELSGNIDTQQYTNLQYFSTPAEFKGRLTALISWARRAQLSTIYGIITLDEDASRASGIYALDDTITKFEDLLIKNIRVPRKYQPPVDDDNRKRRSDRPDYPSIRGNFDLACRTPGSDDNPYMLEFVLYDCTCHDAMSRITTFERFAADLQLKAQVEIFQYTDKNTWTRKTRWSRRRSAASGQRFLQRWQHDPKVFGSGRDLN